MLFIGLIHYKPYSVSSNKRHSKKIVVKKYEKGNKRFRMDEEKTNVLEEEKTNVFEEEETNDNQEFVSTSYHNAQKQLCENWKEILPKLFNIMVENNALPKNQKCFKCENLADYRCLDCGSNIYFCSYCEKLFHHNINIFHRRISLTLSQENQNKALTLPQICIGKCIHQVFKVLVIDLKGK